MKSRTIIIFFIFIALLIVFGLFVFLYRTEVDQLVQKYIAKITVCGNILSEDDCFAQDFCEGIYGPSCPDCQDLEFKRCQRIPAKRLVQLEKEKNLCQNTGGQWYRNKLGNFCLCQPANKIWDKEKGCVNK